MTVMSEPDRRLQVQQERKTVISPVYVTSCIVPTATERFVPGGWGGEGAHFFVFYIRM